MSKSALLAKLKGKTRTFVVHSNTSPYAAAAAMGAVMGRSQALGPYFHFSAKRISGVQAEPAPGAVGELAPSNLSVDFIGDWSEFLRQKGMTVCGLKYDQSRTLEENTMRYLNAQNRRIPSTARRAVHESRELSVPQEYEPDYIALKSLISSGGDLKPYLSRDVLKKKRPDKNDALLNAWGIQHLHFRPEGTAHIPLCRITDTDVFVVRALPHDHDVWVDTLLLQILHDNWPKEIAAGKWHGVPGEAMQSSERFSLRNQNANFGTTVRDGTVYLAPGGGLMASGDCSEDRTDCDKIFAELTYWQEIVRSNAARFGAALNWPVSEELSIRMIFEDRECCLYEPTTGSRLSLTIQQ
jgi:hypothetical protein